MPSNSVAVEKQPKWRQMFQDTRTTDQWSEITNGHSKLAAVSSEVKRGRIECFWSEASTKRILKEISRPQGHSRQLCMASQKA